MRRATEREGRRTRRRCERERNDLLSSHLDGMSSDEETSDRYQEQFQNNLGKVFMVFLSRKLNKLRFHLNRNVG